MSDSHPIVGSVCWGGLQGFPLALGVLLGEGYRVLRKGFAVVTSQPIDQRSECEVPARERG